MQDYKRLDIYKKAKQLSIAVYKVTSNFPKHEFYGITAQLRRASVSIGANIAEGCGRFGRRDFLRFLHNSLGSLREVQYHLELSYDLGYMNQKEYAALDNELDELSKMMYAFTRSVRKQLLITEN